MPRTLTRLVLLVGFLAIVEASGSAASLYGKVEKVDEGDLITITNLNRPLKVRLLGIDAPEKDQAFAQAARQHLSDLVLHKLVVVHYAGLAEKSQILGRVFVGDMDVCAQMIRDGVAWYSRRDAGQLGPSDRDVYGESERLARSERRGIWQDESPVAPWEFKRNVALIPSQPGTPTKKTARAAGLSTEDLFSAISGGSRSRSGGGSYLEWRTLSPEGFNFSISVPGNTEEGGSIIPTSNGKNADVNIAYGSDESTAYLVFWGKGPAYGDPDSVASDVIKGLLRGLNRGRAADVTFSSKAERRIKLGPLTGWQYELSGAGVDGVVRTYSKQSRGELQIFLLAAVNGNEQNQTVRNFLTSFKLNK